MSTTIMMNPQQQYLPHRKPVPGRASYNNLQQQQQQQQQQQPPSQYSVEPQRARGGSNGMQPSVTPSMYSTQQQPAQYVQQNRRAPSNATSTSSSTANNGGLTRTSTNSSGPRRSTSSRSNSSASPTSYVALMRKQKATVWCDRAQHEDPRILAAQRAAKMRAAMEVAGGAHRISTSSNNAPPTVGIRSKIRHHGAPKASTYTGQGNLAGAGVPMRLSATEMEDDKVNNSDEEEDSRYMNYHNRTGSRGSSMGSGMRPPNYLQSNDSTPMSGHSPGGSMDDLAEEETPGADEYNGNAGDYLQAGDSDEAEASYGRLSALPQSTAPKPEPEAKTAEELRRRGSVDDRSMTMTGGRLFIANPDMDD